MKYSLEESLQVLSVRSRRLQKKRKRQSVGALSAASLVLFACLASAIKSAALQLGTEDTVSVFGAFVLPDSAGGYILAGVIAFVLGAAVTLICLRYRKRNTEITGKDKITASEEEKNEEEK